MHEHAAVMFRGKGDGVDVNNDWWPRFSAAEYERRQQCLREAMLTRGLDCLLIYGTGMSLGGGGSACPNLVYLSSYGPAGQGYVVFPREGDPTLLIHNRTHLGNAMALSVIPDVLAGMDIDVIAVKRLRELGYERGNIGIVGSSGRAKWSIPFEHHRTFTEQLPGARFDVVTNWYEDILLLKSAEEIRFMEAGAAICDRAHEALREAVSPGVTDVALQNEAFRVIRDLGGRPSMGHVGSTPMHDPSMTYPHPYPLNRAIQWGDAIMTELGAGRGGYFGKIMGTLFLGKPTEAYRLAFELAAEIYREVAAAIKPGVRGQELEPLFAGRAARYGYRSRSCITGWSTGKTRPDLLPLSLEEEDRAFELQPGLCLNVFAWVTSSDERMGVWIANTALVTEQGLRSLQTYPVDSLDYVTLEP